jgi:hypothetical protein
MRTEIKSTDSRTESSASVYRGEGRCGHFPRPQYKAVLSRAAGFGLGASSPQRTAGRPNYTPARPDERNQPVWLIGHQDDATAMGAAFSPSKKASDRSPVSTAT